MVVIGEVVRLRESLTWYENKPMFGQRILVTREHATGFETLEDLGAEILEFPTIEIVPPRSYAGLDAAIERITTYTWIILTSANGVRYFLKRFFELGRDIRDLKGIKICAIGSKTAAEIERSGMKVDLIPAEFHAEGLVEVFLKGRAAGERETSLKGSRFLLPRAEVARELFPEKVRKLGGEIDVVDAYRAVKPEIHGRRLKRFLREGRVTVATFTSAATFTNFVEIVGSEAYEFLKGITIAVIGPVTKRAVEKAGLRVDIMPEESTIEAMVSEIVRVKAGSKDDPTPGL